MAIQAVLVLQKKQLRDLYVALKKRAYIRYVFIGL